MEKEEIKKLLNRWWENYAKCTDMGVWLCKLQVGWSDKAVPGSVGGYRAVSDSVSSGRRGRISGGRDRRIIYGVAGGWKAQGTIQIFISGRTISWYKNREVEMVL